MEQIIPIVNDRWLLLSIPVLNYIICLPRFCRRTLWWTLVEVWTRRWTSVKSREHSCRSAPRVFSLITFSNSPTYSHQKTSISCVIITTLSWVERESKSYNYLAFFVYILSTTCIYRYILPVGDVLWQTSVCPHCHDVLRVSGLRYDDPRALQGVPRRHAADPGAGHLQAAELRKHPHQVQRVPPQGQFEHTGSLLI